MDKSESTSNEQSNDFLQVNETNEFFCPTNIFPFVSDYSDAQRLDLQEKLIVVIMKTLIKQDSLNYYQVNHRVENKVKNVRFARFRVITTFA